MSDKLVKFAALSRKLIFGLGFFLSVLIALLAVANIELLQPFQPGAESDWFAPVLAIAGLAIGPYVMSALFMLNVDLHVFELSMVPLATSYRAAILFATVAASSALYFNIQSFVARTNVVATFFG